MLQSALPSSTLRNRLLLHLATRRKRAGRLSAGFTLVELMIVIVIVGILSAIAIPNFLTQTQKAKATEAKTQIATTLKQAQAQYIEDGLDPKIDIAEMETFYKTPANGSTKFDYTAAWDGTNKIYTVTATGNATEGDITAKTIKGCANFESGLVAVQSILDDPTDPNCTGTPQE